MTGALACEAIVKHISKPSPPVVEHVDEVDDNDTVKQGISAPWITLKLIGL